MDLPRTIDYPTIEAVSLRVIRRFPSLDPEDTLQEVLITVCRHADDIDHDEAPLRFLRRIAWSKSIDLYRRAQVRVKCAPLLDHDRPVTNTDPARFIPAFVDTAAFIRRCSPPQRRAIQKRVNGESRTGNDAKLTRYAAARHGHLLRTEGYVSVRSA